MPFFNLKYKLEEILPASKKWQNGANLETKNRRKTYSLSPEAYIQL
jgi:hypothetical protein